MAQPPRCERFRIRTPGRRHAPQPANLQGCLYVFWAPTKICAGARPSGRFIVRIFLARDFSVTSTPLCHAEATETSRFVRSRSEHAKQPRISCPAFFRHVTVNPAVARGRFHRASAQHARRSHTGGCWKTASVWRPVCARGHELPRIFLLIFTTERRRGASTIGWSAFSLWSGCCSCFGIEHHETRSMTHCGCPQVLESASQSCLVG